jgi:hypothetical protein
MIIFQPSYSTFRSPLKSSKYKLINYTMSAEQHYMFPKTDTHVSLVFSYFFVSDADDFREVMMSHKCVVLPSCIDSSFYFKEFFTSVFITILYLSSVSGHDFQSSCNVAFFSPRICNYFKLES